jgi:hypothetical protein
MDDARRNDRPNGQCNADCELVPRIDDEEQTTAPRVGGLHKGNPMDKLQTIKFPDGREIKLTECRREGTSLFGKLPNGVEIELNDGDEMTEEEIMSIKRPN